MPGIKLREGSLWFAAATSLLVWAGAAAGQTRTFNFDQPQQSLAEALRSYARASGQQIIFSEELVMGRRAPDLHGAFTADEALARLLRNSDLIIQRTPSGAAMIERPQKHSSIEIPPMQMAQAAPVARAVETVTVTSSKLGGGDVQSIPIAITALSQEQLTSTQTAGGPDLVKQVPNLTFTKTNFSGYSIQIRGIGTQAISVATDPAVAVAFNDVPFIRNHFFEQEFFDVSQVEVLRGPQGTLYGRNATAGVVNLTSAKPTDQFEAMASGEVGNYHQRRLEGMLNIPLVDDILDVRIAGEWTKRQGYSFNELTNQRIDGRDLWSGRVTIGWKPVENLQAYLIWEHFSENDDRLRSSKQLCKTAPIPDTVGGIPTGGGGPGSFRAGNALSQGCLPASPYSSDAFEVPNGFSLPYYSGLTTVGFGINPDIDPYAGTTQSRNLRVIQSSLDPIYNAKNDIAELNIDYGIDQILTLSSQTAFNHDFLWATQDYNRFNTAPGIFVPQDNPDDSIRDHTLISADGFFCDPQLGCSNRLVAQDLSTEHAWQFSQEFRLSSQMGGPLNFSIGGNYLHYETEENYYVFINTLSLFAAHPFESVTEAIQNSPWIPGVSDNHECFGGSRFNPGRGFQYSNPADPGAPGECAYIDPNSVENLNDQGHNYFLSQNPYTLNSFAAFGEAYYNLLQDLKLTAGLRWTEDRKHFIDIPSELEVTGYGYPMTGIVDQQWDALSGRAALNWSPKISFTDQTLLYASYAHGYKAGGANPPGAVLLVYTLGADIANPVHPLTFKPEFVDAFELGTKNTLFDGNLTLNGNIFYYNYEHYQISEIIDRTAINLNFDAHIKGAEVEGVWEPIQGLRFNFGGGWEDAVLAKGTKAVDLMDRTAGHTDWMVVKPSVTQASNCILPVAVVASLLDDPNGVGVAAACGTAYNLHVDPAVIPFDPTAAPNNGAGFDEDLSGNKLPNAPPYTISVGAQYSMAVSSDWAATLRSDFYWQDNFWARVFNDDPYDRIHGYSTLNLALILSSQSGWQIMLFDKNAFDTTAITGSFLNSDDTGLTTNIFLTDPKLIGIRVTKNW